MGYDIIIEDINDVIYGNKKCILMGICYGDSRIWFLITMNNFE
jgi:hypothetical protein